MKKKQKKGIKKSAQGQQEEKASNHTEIVALLMYDYHIVENNGKNSLIGVFDTLGAKKFPAKFLMYLFIKIKGKPGKHVLYIELIEKKTGRNIIRFPKDEFIIPQTPVAYHDVISQLDFEFSEPGLYEWQVIVDNTQKSSYTFQVVSRNQQDQNNE